MERVPQETVLAHWLSVETGKPSVDNVEGMGTEEMLDALLRQEPAAHVLWQAQPVTWYHLTLTAAELDRLRVVEGPSGMGWRALAPDGTVGSAAERIARGAATALDARGVDIERVRAMADGLAADESVADLVLAKRQGCERPYVVDGNHRAAALALHAVRGSGKYDPVGAYLGVGATPVLEPLWQHVDSRKQRKVIGPACTSHHQ